MKSRSFIDTCVLHAVAGSGGNGSNSFRREKFEPKGGPDGGDGGRGGHIYLVGDEDVDSLISIYYAPERRASDGGAGRGRYQHGANGRDIEIPVPLGTRVKDEETGRELGEILHHGQKLLAAEGGKGGIGNLHFKSSTHQAPREFTPGKPGEDVRLRLDLALLADVGLVGFPSAGKSSLLREITAAHPKVASYHFTTLRPIIGTVMLPEKFASFRIADIPGIIKDAHKGAGLGHEFMRHIERSKVLVFVIDMGGEEGRSPVEDYRTLLDELEQRDPALLERPRIVVASKMDLEDARKNVREFRKETGIAPIETTILEPGGFEKLVRRLVRLLKPQPNTAGRPPVAQEISVKSISDALPHRRVGGKTSPKPLHRHEKTGRESSPGHTPPKPIEGRGEHPDAADVISARTQKLGTFFHL